MRENKVDKKLNAERLSQRMLYILIGFIAVSFGAFYLIGFDMPFVENPAFNAPLLTDLVIITMWVLFAGTLAIAGFSLFKAIRSTAKSESVVNNIPVRKISIVVFSATLLCLVLTFVLGSSEAMQINGEEFTDRFWLKAADMFVSSSIILLVSAIGVVIFGATRYYRKRQ